jgi:hypothetical protein
MPGLPRVFDERNGVTHAVNDMARERLLTLRRSVDGKSYAVTTACFIATPRDGLGTYRPVNCLFCLTGEAVP